MKSKTKNILAALLAGVMAFGLIFIGSSQSAQAVSKTTSFNYNTGSVIAKSYIHTSDNYKNVYATVELGRSGTWETAAYCKLYLQRYTSGSWKTIDTASGNAAYGKKLNVTFTNIAKKSASTRVKVKLYNNWDHTDLIQTVYSSKWTR
ncbi:MULTISPECIES: hypothetical protein [Bacillus]|uniref:RBAM029550 n=1 Tax=Bacillus amyloliquefaciens (strain ATCC 23350 / DSM 7 / BCRC 11601 / CCUG 28519 / NBRC 15535 / NRRL B-14393 / F) TaxID=692420 RepID=A0A9P1JK18_BACAS|nr:MULTISPECIES: hypothetical protein [Bacillus amyloliquefaciens group]AIW35091.1 hypothetical protein KS08_16145 [Bacillus subtilis]AEB25435.1 hypothetical protein BAMTA208_16415 [Bacillus amyloliquefaciens TA208]ARW40434.1 hypothetical protein S101267_03375 [Bacillus amyloliquefaciens]ASF29994.1 hypothetical protein WV34_15035 [Bacillus amyloliquefaciens]AZV90530.1 hypothetical protein BUN12_2278 [Bacillus amyloliquefaciens]